MLFCIYYYHYRLTLFSGLAYTKPPQQNIADICRLLAFSDIMAASAYCERLGLTVENGVVTFPRMLSEDLGDNQKHRWHFILGKLAPGSLVRKGGFGCVCFCQSL